VGGDGEGAGGEGECLGMVTWENSVSRVVPVACRC
jgi:hypothetical protein